MSEEPMSSPMDTTETSSTSVQDDLPKEIKLICEKPLLGWHEAKCTHVDLKENGIAFGRLQNSSPNTSMISKFNITVAHTDITRIKLSRPDLEQKRYLFFTISMNAAEKIIEALKIESTKYDFNPEYQPTIRFYFKTEPSLTIHVTKYVQNYCKATRKSVLELDILEAKVAEGMVIPII